MKVFISVERAQELILLNTYNRPISYGKVREYSGYMKDGAWLYNGESIKLSETNVILDGQKRLLAIIDSGVGITTEFVEGLEDKVFPTIDCGQIRLNKDMFAIQGVANYAKTATAVTVFMSLNMKIGVRSLKGAAYADVFQAYEDNMGIFDALDYNRKVHGASPRLVLGCQAYLLQFNEYDLVEEFFNSLANGTACSSSQPQILREALIRGALHSTHNLTSKEVTARILKAFHNMKHGLNPKTIRWISPKLGPVFPYDTEHTEVIPYRKVKFIPRRTRAVTSK